MTGRWPCVCQTPASIASRKHAAVSLGICKLCKASQQCVNRKRSLNEPISEVGRCEKLREEP